MCDLSGCCAWHLFNLLQVQLRLDEDTANELRVCIQGYSSWNRGILGCWVILGDGSTMYDDLVGSDCWGVVVGFNMGRF